MATAQEIAAALRYGPQTAGLVRRSAYLQDALAAMQQQGGQNIRSPVELGAKLIATALLSRASNKSQDATLGAMRANQDAETSSMLAAFQKPTPAPAPAIMPPAQAQAPAPPPQAPAPAPMPRPQAPGPQASAQDRDALIRMVATEAGGEGPDGMLAAGHVALNRLRSGYGGAKSLADVVMAPHQFEGMSRAGQVKPDDYQRAGQVVDAILSGQAADPTGGAINFLNPELQTQLGRKIPSWAQGQGQRIGRHVFFGGGQQAAQSVPPPPMPPSPNGPAEQPATPYQVASIGPTPPPPSAPEVSPSGVGAPPAAPPQAAAGGNADWPMQKASEQEIAWARALALDPRTHDAGIAELRKLQHKMTQPVEAVVQMINGAPFYVPKTPGDGPPVMIPVPKEAMTQVMAAQAAGLQGAPQGLNVQRDPMGNLKEAPGAPPQGYEVGPNNTLHYRQGGPDDPTRPQTPQQGFAYAPGGGQAPIQGGPADPRSPQNLIAGEGKLRDDYEKQIQPYIQAREGYQKVIQAAKNASPAGDIALVFGYMKTLDPGSTVREGEQATVQNSGTIDQTVQNMYNKLITGQGRLSEAQRAQFAESARNQFQVYQRTYDAASERFGGLAQSYGFDPSRVVRKFDPIEPYTPGPGAADYPAAVNLAHQNMVARGQYDPKAPLGDVKRPALMRSAADIQAFDTPQNKGKRFIGPDGRVGVVD